MGFHMEEEKIWKCLKHLSKHRKIGVCPLCLKDRLIKLCPDCANERPCTCCPTTSSTSSSLDRTKSCDNNGATGSLSHLIDEEPSFRRSRSVAFQFLRPNLSRKDAGSRFPLLNHQSRSSFWSVFKSQKEKKVEEVRGNDGDENEEVKKMMRSKSIGFLGYSYRSQPLGGEVRVKRRSWFFPNPNKVIRKFKTANSKNDHTCAEEEFL